MKTLITAFAALALTTTPALASDTLSDLRIPQAGSEAQTLIADCTSETASSRAVRACTKASRLVKGSDAKGELIARRGLHRLALGQYDKAGADFERAGSLTQDTTLASLGTGFAAMMDRDLPTARARFEDCRSSGALAPLAQYGLGMTHQMSGDTDEARQAYSRALAMSPDFSPAAEQLSTLG